MTALTEYFRAEKAIGIAIIPVGLAMLALAGHILRNHAGAFMWASAVPLLLAGLGAVGGGIGLTVRTQAQVPALEARYAQDPRGMVAEEQVRMARVNANWPILKGIWTGLVLLGLVLVMAVKREWAQGLGPSLLLLGALVMLIDVYAERRALVYTAALESAR